MSGLNHKLFEEANKVMLSEVISMGKGIYEVDAEALAEGKFILLTVICTDIEKE